MIKRPPKTGAVLGLGRLSRCGGNNLAFRPGMSTSGSDNRSDLQQSKASFHPATPPTFCKTQPPPTTHHPPPQGPKRRFRVFRLTCWVPSPHLTFLVKSKRSLESLACDDRSARSARLQLPEVRQLRQLLLLQLPGRGHLLDALGWGAWRGGALGWGMRGGGWGMKSGGWGGCAGLGWGEGGGSSKF